MAVKTRVSSMIVLRSDYEINFIKFIYDAAMIYSIYSAVNKESFFKSTKHEIKEVRSQHMASQKCSLELNNI